MEPLSEERILGVPVDAVDRKAALAHLVALVEQGVPAVAVAVNPEKVLAARENPWLLRFLEGAALRIPDGIGIVWASKRQGGTIRSRLTGMDLFLSLIETAAGRGWPVFLLGARPGVAEAAGRALCAAHPALRLAGVRDGYFPLDEGGQVAAQVRAAGATILFVAMGSPRQEHWLFEHFEETGAVLAMGVGGGFDVVSGRVRRAPTWVQALGLEWLFRFLLEPRARWRRMGKLGRFVWEMSRRTSQHA